MTWVMEVRLSCYLVLPSTDSKTRQQDRCTSMTLLILHYISDGIVTLTKACAFGMRHKISRTILLGMTHTGSVTTMIFMLFHISKSKSTHNTKPALYRHALTVSTNNAMLWEIAHDKNRYHLALTALVHAYNTFWFIRIFLWHISSRNVNW